jgi:predicted HAD superfamily Cof-like phosphohydrolase
MIYDNLSDSELIRQADGQGGLIKALSERLDMRQQPQSVFHDQAFFMRACGQTTTEINPTQAKLYRALIEEEMRELKVAELQADEVEEFDAVLDLLVVLIGYGLSRGWPMLAGWDEVMRSNMAKIDPRTGMVNKREDGKVLKPEGWTPPALADVLKQYQNF